MAYTKTNWVDGETPITANNLNKIENQLENNTNDIENLIAYSSDEIVIGKWINNKPIYRKVIQTTSPSSAGGWVQISNLSSYNIDTLVKMEGFLIATDGRKVPINYPEPSYTICTTMLSGKIEMKIQATTWQSKNVYIVIDYTKTTDV